MTKDEYKQSLTDNGASFIKEHKEYVHYSSSQRQQARDTDMIEFLRYYEGFTFTRAGSGWRCDQHNSLVVNKDRKMWYWNSTHENGITAIDYLQTIHGKTYLEAMDILVGKDRAEIPVAPKLTQQEKDADKELHLPDKCKEGYKRVCAYLIKSRGLDQDIVDYCIKEKIIYQDSKNNAIFVGYDENKNPKFACARGTLSDRQFRGDCKGSDKKYCFEVKGKTPERLYVFEAPIDLLSYISISKKNDPNQSWKNHNFISLSGTSDVALENYLERNKNVTSIIFCLDNDEAGNKASEDYIKKYSEKGYKALRKAPKGKDFNDDLVKSLPQKQKEGEAVLIQAQSLSR